MRTTLCWSLLWVVCVVPVCVFQAGLAWAEDPARTLREVLGEALGEVLDRAGRAFDTEFRAPRDAPGTFTASVTSGLTTCESIELEVRVEEDGAVEVTAFPCLGGGRIDIDRAVDKVALARGLITSDPAPALLAWVVAEAGALHARRTIAGDDAAAAEVERTIRAVTLVDRAVAGLLPSLGLEPRLTESEITSRLREAGTADEARRNALLATLAPYLTELTPSDTPGESAFRKLSMNTRGVAFDAFRFRVPVEGDDRRLVWAFAFPPGTAKGWYIAPVAGDPPKFTRFHPAKTLTGTDVPAEHAVLLQRSETPLRAGATYVIWFQFKVETPVEMRFALGCYPFSKSDRDGLEPLSAALGLKTSR